ncbi:MAG: phosphatidylserine decarboxylase [Treponema sp.]|jgi:phosphatidylserine decarboxylase|nr:phosphatidylserine decarboxylase [Treponema sp.]
MRLPFTRYGLPQVLLYPALILALMAALALLAPRTLWLIPAEILLCLILLWALSFFRDPKRVIPLDEAQLLSPADGTITDISEAEVNGLDGRALRIGVFLSVFNVHINRSPCSARIESVIYQKGRYKNALSPESSRVNESNAVLMTRLEEPRDRILVRQVSGAVARRIVCAAKPGREYRQGEPFGMIKFGSRTELYIPLREGAYEVRVSLGDTVYAGISPLIAYLKQAPR